MRKTVLLIYFSLLAAACGSTKPETVVLPPKEGPGPDTGPKPPADKPPPADPDIALAAEAKEFVAQMNEELRKLYVDASVTSWANETDITPEHEVMLLWEQLRELDRSNDTASRSADYRAKLGNAEEAVGSLRQTFLEVGTPATIDQSFARVGAMCSDCHKRYRNN